MAVLAVIELGAFGGDLRPEDGVVTVAKGSLGRRESFLRAGEISPLASNHRSDSCRSGGSTRVANAPRRVERAVTPILRSVYVAPSSEQFRLTKLSVQDARGLAERARD